MATASWIGLILLGAFDLYAALADLAAGAGLPSDHTGTFTAVTGRTWASFKDPRPGAAHYITLVERGYALHELVFAALFLVIVTIPLRAGQRCCGVEHESVGGPGRPAGRRACR